MLGLILGIVVPIVIFVVLIYLIVSPVKTANILLRKLNFKKRKGGDKK